MPGFNGGTIPALLLNTLLTPADKLRFDQFIYRLLPKTQFDGMTGLAPTLPVAQGHAGTFNSARDLFVAGGAPTPLSNFELSSRKFRLHEAREAASINHIASLDIAYFSSELQSIMSQNIGLAVATRFELLLQGILQGLAAVQSVDDGTNTTITALTNAQRFDVYGTSAGGASDVAATIHDMQEASGGRNCIIGPNVMRALARHPQFTNRFTGNGREILGHSEVIGVLREFGLDGTIYASGHQYSSNPREQAYNGTDFFSNVFTVFADGAIQHAQHRGDVGMSFDNYGDANTKVNYLRAQEIGGIFIPHADQVVVLTNVLTP